MTRIQKRFKLSPPIQATFILLLAVTLLQTLTAGKINLSADEANYALYGLHLQWSYFDHPPMVGWLQALIIPFSHSDFAMRLWPMLFNVATAIVLYQLSKILFPKNNKWMPFLSIAIMQSAIILHLLSIAFVPQVPFLFFSLLVILSLYQAVKSNKLLHFILLGFFLGLSALSEYTAFLLVIVTILYIGSIKIQLLFNYKLWLSATIAIIISLPVFYWNAAHNWISFHYQTHHVLHNQAWSFIKFFESQTAQFLVYSPGIYIIGLITIILTFKQWHNLANRLLSITIIVILLFFAYGSGDTFTLPHWPALAWTCNTLLIANYISQNWNKLWLKIIVCLSAIYSLLIILFVHFYVIFSLPHFSLNKNPLIDVQGWDKAAQMAKIELHRYFLNQKAMLFVPSWTLSSRIAWYANMPVQITRYGTVSQTSLWYGKPNTGENGILIIPFRWHSPAKHGMKPGQFKTCHFIKKLTIKKQQQIINQFNYYRCFGYIT